MVINFIMARHFKRQRAIEAELNTECEQSENVNKAHLSQCMGIQMAALGCRTE